MTLAEQLKVPGWEPESYESNDDVFRLTIKFLDEQRAEAADRITELESDLAFVKEKLLEYVASGFDPGMMAPTLDDLRHRFNLSE